MNLKRSKKIKILVIHGFNSSPLSLKAQLTIDYVAKHRPDIEVVCPQLLSTPNGAIEQLSSIIDSEPECQWYLTGSSLGGFFATFLAKKYALVAVLINPAVKPFALLEEIIGEQTNPYTNEVYQVTAEHMEQLKSFETEVYDSKSFLVMVQTGDEVLDYQQAVAKYQQCNLVIQQGGNHSFIDFAEMLPRIMTFFNLDPSQV